MSHFYTHSHYHLLRMKEMGRIYWCHSIGALGVSLVAIFVPIYLLKIGYTFTDVLVFLLFQQVFSILLSYIVGLLLQHIRPHYMMIIGSFWYIVFFGLLITLTQYYWPLLLLSFVWALNRTFYWIAFHYCFSLSRKHEHGGEQVAGLNALVILSTTTAPAVGGIIATLFGINYIYWGAIILLVIASVPMINASKGPKPGKLKISKKWLKKIHRDMIANCFNGMALMTEQSLWPIFIFLIVTSYAGIGLLSSVIALAGILTALYVGRKEEVRGEHRYIKQGAFIYALASMGRILTHTPAQIFGLNLLSGIGRSLYITPFMNRYYMNSEGEYRLAYVTVMEIAFAVGGTLFMTTIILLTILFSIKAALLIGFAYAAFLITGARFIR